MSHLFYLLTHIAETIIPMFEWMGAWSYVLLFILIFMETGLVIFPWLPGESLVFLTCSFIAFNPILKMEIVIPVFFFAALIGDTVNYYIGHSLSHWLWLKRRIFSPSWDQSCSIRTICTAHSDLCPLNRRNNAISISPFHNWQYYWRYIMGSDWCWMRILLWNNSICPSALLTYHLSICCGFTVRSWLVNTYQSDSSTNY